MPQFEATFIRYVQERAVITIDAPNKLLALAEARDRLPTADALDWEDGDTSDTPQIDKIVPVFDVTPRGK